MVFFALTTIGFRNLVETMGRVPSPIWLNAGILDRIEIDKLRSSGINLTVFSQARDPFDSSDISQAVATIQMHHDQDTIWVETPPAP